MSRTLLDASQLDELRQSLLDRRREITGDLIDLQEEHPGRGSPEGDMGSRAPTHPADEGTDEHGRSLDKQLIQTERDIVVEIDEALLRMEHETYGLCDECGEPVELDRLRARPWSRMCKEHAEEEH